MDIPALTFIIAGGFAFLAVGDRGIKELTRWHSDRVAAATAGSTRFNDLCSSLIEDENTPEEIVQIAVCLSDMVGTGHLASTAVTDLRGDTRPAVQHLLEFLPHDMSDAHTKKLVSLIRAALAATAPLTWKPVTNSVLLHGTADHLLVAVVVHRLDC